MPSVIESLERRDCPAVMFAVQPPSSMIYEGDTAIFTVRLLQASSQPERVAVTVASGTAALGQDFLFSNSTQLLFAPGQTRKSFAVRTFTDSVREPAETFTVTAASLTSPDATPVTRTGRIFDLIPSTLRADGASVVEGNSGTKSAQFTVRLEGSPTAPVTVNYATSDVTATAGTDYTATSGVLTFAPGETVKTISVPVLGDTEAEVDETFRLNFTNPSRGMTIATPFVTGTIVNDESDQPGFQITIDYVTSFFGEVPVSVRNATQQAVQRWQQVITGDVPGYFEESTGRFVDDFRMRVQMGLLFDPDGSDPGALANASPLQYREGNGLPWLGETGIDPADVSNPQLVAILMHEIGHALGFAPGNEIFDQWVTGTTWTGPNAVREYGSLAGSTVASVPLETGGGGGTVGAHWSEDTFGNELMTGYAEAAGVAMPLSRLTIGAFADLGYTVNYAAADPFTLPAGIAGIAAQLPSQPPSTPRPPVTPPAPVAGPTHQPPSRVPAKPPAQPPVEETQKPAAATPGSVTKPAIAAGSAIPAETKPTAPSVREAAFASLAAG